MRMVRKRPQIEPTEDFQQILPLCWWPEQVECEPAVGAHSVGKLRRVKGHTLYETSIVMPQPRLFDLGEVLGEVGWVKFLKLDEYAPRQPRRPDELQQVLFPYTEAI